MLNPSTKEREAPRSRFTPTLLILTFLFCLSLPLSQAALTDNLLGYWSFDNATVSSTIYDSTAKYNLTDPGGANSPTYNTTLCKNSGCAGFGGDAGANSDYFYNGNWSTAISTTENFTMACWAYPQSGAADAAMVSTGNAGNSDREEMRIIATTSFTGAVRAGGVESMYRVPVGTFSTWQLLVMTYTESNTTVSVWKNATFIGANASAGTATTETTLRFGVFGNAIDDGWFGLIDECAIWDRAITGTEINQLWNSGTGFFYPFTAATTASIIFQGQTPTNATSLYYNNSFTVNTTTTVTGASVNTSHFLYNSSFSLISQLNTTGQNVTNTFTFPNPGIYYFNASATNGTFHNYTETRTIYSYTIATAGINTPGNNTNSAFIQQNISWNASTINPTASSVTITKYNISLENNLGVYNQTINANVGTNTSYNWTILNAGLSIGQYYIRVWTWDNNTKNASITTLINITRNGLLNLTAKDARTGLIVNTGSINITNLDTGLLEIFNTTNGNLSIPIIKGGNYTITADFNNYSINTQNYTANITNTQLLNISLYTNNSLTTNIYDEDSGLIITQNITLTYTGTFETSHTTTTGQDYIDGLTDGSWTIKLIGANYSLKQYVVSVGDRSHQSLDAFLSQSTATTILTATDFDSGATITEVTITQSRLINGTWTTISTKDTDITGRAQFSYVSNVNYRFQATKTGYNTLLFELNPVLFSTYTIQLHRQVSQVPSNTPAFQDVTITYYPMNFTTNTNHTLTYTISSPMGALTNYNLSITAPGGVNTLDTGSNAYGETITRTFAIPTTNTTDRVTLTYCFQTTTSASTCQIRPYSIIGSISNHTFVNMTPSMTSHGILNKAIIAAIILMFLSAIFFYTLGTGAGTIVLIFGFALLYRLGFLSLWLTIPSMVILVLFLLKVGSDSR